MQRSIHRGFVLRRFFLGACLVFGASSCAKPPGMPTPPKEVTVRTVVAATKSVKRIHSFPGVTASVRPVVVSARVTGFLEKQHAPDGAMVKAGDLLYSIDQRPFVASAKQARGTLQQAQAQVPGAKSARDLAARDVDRNRPLASSGAISKQSFDQLETKLATSDAQLASAMAAVDSASAQLELAELNVSYCTIKAPMDGALGATQAFEGQMVGPGYTVQLNELMELDPMWLDFAPSATEWPLVREQLALGPVNALVIYGGNDSVVAQGTLSYTSNSVEASTSTLAMRVTFPNPKGEFRPGTYATVSLDLGVIPDVLMIPMQALVAREAEFVVWRVGANNTVSAVAVQVGAREGEDVGIIAGISAGDRIVAAGSQKLVEGTTILEESATAAPASIPTAGK